MQNYHQPVLLHESIEGLQVQPGGTYVDVTFGGGGHSKAILQQLGHDGRLVAFDQDEDAKQNLPTDERLIFVQHNFRYFKNFLKYYNIQAVDGILADLGVSSHHFDDAQRGFSFRFDTALDMRMNRNAKQTAETIVNTYTAEELIAILKQYGELKNARKTANLILKFRELQPLKTTGDLIKAVENCVPERNRNKFFAKLFQALRIEVNREIDVLKQFLLQTAGVLKPDARLVVITYHSLEDRLVKNFIRKGNFEGEVEKDFYGKPLLIFQPVNRKVIVPSEAEIKKNNRARSAKLRIARRLSSE